MILFVYFPFDDFAGDLHGHAADFVFQFVDGLAFLLNDVSFGFFFQGSGLSGWQPFSGR